MASNKHCDAAGIAHTEGPHAGDIAIVSLARLCLLQLKQVKFFARQFDLSCIVRLSQNSKVFVEEEAMTSFPFLVLNKTSPILVAASVDITLLQTTPENVPFTLLITAILEELRVIERNASFAGPY